MVFCIPPSTPFRNILTPFPYVAFPRLIGIHQIVKHTFLFLCLCQPPARHVLCKGIHQNSINTAKEWNVPHELSPYASHSTLDAFNYFVLTPSHRSALLNPSYNSMECSFDKLSRARPFRYTCKLTYVGVTRFITYGLHLILSKERDVNSCKTPLPSEKTAHLAI